MALLISISAAQEPDEYYVTIDNTTKLSVSKSGQGTILPDPNNKIEPAYLPSDNWGASVQGFALSVRVEIATIPVGNPVNIALILRNTSTNTIEFGVAVTERDFEIIVVDDQRKLVPHTAYGKLLKHPHYSGGGGWFFPPHAQKRYGLQVDKLFEMQSKGDYLVYAKMESQTEGGQLTELISGNAIIHIVDAPKTAGQANTANTTTTSSSPTALANPGAASAVSGSSPGNSRPSVRAAEPQSTANPPKNILPPAAQAPTSQPPVQLAQAETGGGLSKRDWVFSLLVLGLVLGLGWYLFRARAPHPKS